MNTRKESNDIILGIISDSINKYTDLRFGQILIGLNIIQYEMNTYDETCIVLDPFHIEPNVMLNNIKQSNLYKSLYEKNRK